MTEKLLSVGFVLGCLFTLYWSFALAVAIYILAKAPDGARLSPRVFPKVLLFLSLSISMIYICS